MGIALKRIESGCCELHRQPATAVCYYHMRTIVATNTLLLLNE